ncbi:hypothetical protein J2S13_000929 [Oikeobacillus pervagus]|uniref:Uncharacterized protein n=1 Tax=Oikeobacillus pervagus TaxID=1325931 RepID=A0AAJ1WIK8_9BACI|nr:hypothetical protein [Oikeobacillus pervagus]MDQ0214533.1 hypothetical protein [Oikeobacillus pervagus]
MKKWIMTENGNTLILVLLISVIFMTIGMAIVAATIGGSKRTSIREAEVNTTYEAVKVLDQITADLSRHLRVEDYEIENLRTATVSNKIREILDSIKNEYLSENGIERIEYKDVTTNYKEVKPSETLTRVFEISVTTKTEEGKGKIDRTAKKRLIISPLPSFLKYAVGSEKGILSLNGSPNIAGNVFANNLHIQEEAKYFLPNDAEDDPSTIKTPYPSVIGDLYANDFKADKIYHVLKADHFYKQRIPYLKNDSQYQEVHFDEAFEEEKKKIEGKVNLFTMEDFPTIEYPEHEEFLTDKIVDGKYWTYDEKGKAIVHSLHGSHIKQTGDLTITNTNSPSHFKNVEIGGDLTIVANQNMSVDNLIVDGKVEIINNHGQFTVQGKVKAKSIKVINTEEGSLSMEAIFSEDEIRIENKKTMKINGSIASKGKVFIKNIGMMNIQSLSNLYSGEKLEFNNKGNLTIETDLVSSGTIILENSQSLNFSGDMYSTGEMKLISHNNDDTQIAGTLLSVEDLTIRGDSDDEGDGGDRKENDSIEFDAVIYTQGKATVSNLNIKGLPRGQIKKQLILLSRDKLLITRVNEFNNFHHPKETKDAQDYIPHENEAITPLKAFFYTESNAELYGVGSLFFINGGLFAKKDLEINVIRGEIYKIDEASPTPNSTEIDQEDHYSRFIVDYNKSILLQNFDSLPKVDYLTIYSDVLTIE